MIVSTMTQERPPSKLRWYGPKLRGWLACDFGKPIAENPHEPETDDWWDFRDGWFWRNEGNDAVEECATWDDVPSE